MKWYGRYMCRRERHKLVPLKGGGDQSRERAHCQRCGAVVAKRRTPTYTREEVAEMFGLEPPAELQARLRERMYGR